MSRKRSQILAGLAHAYGDNIDTDRIIPGKYTKTLDLSQLANHVLEDLDPEFVRRVRPGDLLVAGHNFGCGSSREQAPLALKAVGVSAVVATFFARIFYRNSINIGLPVVEIGEHAIRNQSQIEVDLQAGVVTDCTAGKVYYVAAMPRVMVEILQQGGLVAYLSKFGNYRLS